MTGTLCRADRAAKRLLTLVVFALPREHLAERQLIDDLPPHDLVATPAPPHGQHVGRPGTVSGTLALVYSLTLRALQPARRTVPGK